MTCGVDRKGAGTPTLYIVFLSTDSAVGLPAKKLDMDTQVFRRGCFVYGHMATDAVVRYQPHRSNGLSW